MFQDTNPLTIDVALAFAAASCASEGPRSRGYCVAREDEAPSSNYGAKDSIIPLGHAPHDVAIIDALSFSVKPALTEEFPHRWVLAELSRFLPIAEVQHKMRKGGWAGYKFSMDLVGIGLIAWGGQNQRGTVSVSLMGGGCSTVVDWQGLQNWLEQHKAKLNRVDLAHDDFTGQNINIAWAIKEYQTGGFNGNPPTKPTIPKVEISRREFPHEEIQVFRQPDHGGAGARRGGHACS